VPWLKLLEIPFKPWIACTLERTFFYIIYFETAVWKIVEPLSYYYFSLSLSLCSPASTRNKQSFAHRLCVRVMADPKDKTLTITDLGSGMTRGTLINGLGIGHLSRRAMKAAAASKKKRLDDNDNATTNVQQQQQQQPPEEEDGGKDESDDEEEDGGMDEATSDDDDDDDSLSSDDMEEETTTTSADDDDDSEAENNAIPCRVKDVGGFYAALFALAVGVNVGTKVREAQQAAL
jgi:hypothetical protein